METIIGRGKQTENTILLSGFIVFFSMQFLCKPIYLSLERFIRLEVTSQFHVMLMGTPFLK